MDLKSVKEKDLIMLSFTEYKWLTCGIDHQMMSNFIIFKLNVREKEKINILDHLTNSCKYTILF